MLIIKMKILFQILSAIKMPKQKTNFQRGRQRLLSNHQYFKFFLLHIWDFHFEVAQIRGVLIFLGGSSRFFCFSGSLNAEVDE